MRYISFEICSENSFLLVVSIGRRNSFKVRGIKTVLEVMQPENPYSTVRILLNIQWLNLKLTRSSAVLGCYFVGKRVKFDKINVFMRHVISSISFATSAKYMRDGIYNGTGHALALSRAKHCLSQY